MGHLVKLHYPEAPDGSWSIAGVGGGSAVAFSDADCTLPETDRSLTSQGRARFYLDDIATVLVADADGVVVDGPWQEGTRADLVGMNSPFWSGTKPDGTQGAGGTLSLVELEAARAASFGSSDGYVKETGQSTALLLKDALASVRQANLPFFNVKSSPYNAVGDNTAIDSAPVQAAINAAAAAGGGVVYFPHGGYKCPTGLSITNGSVSLLGEGPASFINYTAASGYAVTMTGSGAALNYLRNLRINVASVGGGHLQVSNNPGYLVDGCLFSGVTDTPAGVSTSTSMFFSNNQVTAGVSTLSRGFIEITGTTPYVVVSSNALLLGATVSQFVRVLVGATNGQVVVANNSLGSSAALAVAATTGTFIASCNATTVTNAVIAESGSEACNFYEAGTGKLVLSGGTGRVTTATRDATSVTAAAGAAFTPVGTAKDNVIDLNANATINAPSPNSLWDGAEIRLRMRNTTGGAITMTYNAAYLQGGVTPGNLAAGATRVTIYVRKETGTTPGWRLQTSQDST